MAQFTHSLCEEVIRTQGKCGLTRNEIVQLANLALRVLKPAGTPPRGEAMQEALKLAEQWRGRADDAGLLARTILSSSTGDSRE